MVCEYKENCNIIRTNKNSELEECNNREVPQWQFLLNDLHC